jgi:hypothetical protein
MGEYNSVLPRFATVRNPRRPRNEWCSVKLYQRAEEAGPGYVDLYRMFYGQASSMYHLDFGGIAAHSDENMQADMAPSWSCLDDALVATGSAVRTASLFDEMAALGFKERVESGPLSEFVEACKTLKKSK